MITMPNFLLTIILLSTSLYSLADDNAHHMHADITIKNPIVRITPPGITTSAGYFSLTNNSDTDIELNGASSKLADRTEIHEHTMKDGLMKMQQVKSIIVPANSTVNFKPGGYHIMLINLAEPITQDTKYELSLYFNKDLKKTITAIGMNPESLPATTHHKHSKKMLHQHKH